MSTVTVGSNAVQEAPPEVLEAVRERLKALDPLLDLRWFPHVVYSEERETLEGRYGLICQWPSSDPRWELYRSGDIGEPFDCLGWFTESAATGDWHEPSALPVSPEQLEEKLIEFLGRMDMGRQSWHDRMRKAAEQNAAQRKRVADEAVDEATQRLSFYRKKLHGEPIVSLGAALEQSTETTQEES